MLTLNVLGQSPPAGLVTGRQVNTWYDAAGELCSRFFVDGRRGWVDWWGLGVFGFEHDRTEVQLWPAPGVSAELAAETFDRTLQPAILQALGWQAMHASAVVGTEGVLAFTGTGHSGKSTVAFALQRAGFSQWADDALVLTIENDAVVAHALPFVSRLRPASLAHFAVEGAPVQLLRSEPNSSRSTSPIAAFFVLAQDSTLTGPDQLTRLSSAQAFPELLAHAHCFDRTDPIETRRIVEAYLAIAQCVPVFRLTYRPGFDRLPGLVSLIAETSLALRGELVHP